MKSNKSFPIIVLLLQVPFEGVELPYWIDSIQNILNIFLALIIRGYLIFVLIGFMIYMTGISDGLAKTFVIVGVVAYLVGPYILELVAGMAGINPPTLTEATVAWIGFVGMTDADLITLLVTLGDMMVAIGILVGAILYFVPTSSDLKSKGQSLIVRALMLSPVLVFFHIAPWI